MADAFEFVPDHPCAAAFNWGSSFGYADADRQNIKMLERAFESLKPGGRFILDYQNIPGVLRDFRQCIVRRHATDDGEILLLRDCQVNLAGGQAGAAVDVRTGGWPPDRGKEQTAALSAACDCGDVQILWIY